MPTVSIHPTLLQPLQRMAEYRQMTVEELVIEVIEKRLEELWERRFDEEAERYRSMHQQLREQYADKVIALYEGEVIAVGEDIAEVYDRVRANYGEEPIYFTRVGPEPFETYRAPSFRLVDIYYDEESV